MNPHRVGLFFIATINILSLWNHYVCVHGGIHHSRFFVAKNRIPRRFKATKMSCKKHITDQFSSQGPDPSDGWVLITATMSVVLRVSRENSGQSAIPRANGSIFHGNFSKYTQKYMMSFAIYPWNNTNNKTLTAGLLFCLLHFE